MKVNTNVQNKGLVSLITNPSQLVTIDANILIPFDRTQYNNRVPPISFEIFKQFWLEPLLDAFPNLALHEAVLEELQSSSVQEYVKKQINSSPPRLRLLADSVFDKTEEIYRKTLEKSIAYYTNYDPNLDNKADRGEVKTLAHIGTKGYLYFCSHDYNAVRLIEQAEELKTNLENVNAIQPFEIIYYLYKMGIGDGKGLRMLYKYLYHLTSREKAVNPDWNDFVTKMDSLYGDFFEAAQ